MKILFAAATFVEWLVAQAMAKRPYWYGSTYLPCTESLLAYKAKQYPKHYAESRMSRYRQDIRNGQICGDCVGGAIKGAAWTELGTRKNIYASNGVPDLGADGMFEWCKKQGAAWGGIGSLPERPGVALRCAGHVGVYVGDGKAVEWRGFAWGCVITEVRLRSWTHWYELPWVDYGAEAGANDPAASLLGARLLKKGAVGQDVKELQEALNSLGFDAGEADGEYGILTLRAVKRLQEAALIDVDGEYGPMSHAALMGMLAEREGGGQEDSGDAPKRVARVTAGVAANIRAGAGTEYGIVTIARKGLALPCLAVADNGWICGKLDGGSGWISPKMAVVEEAGA